MDDKTLEAILRDIQWLKRNACFLRDGEVTDDSPLTITLGGGTIEIASVSRHSSYTPTIGDRVSVLVRGNSLLVLGDKT